VESLVYPDLAAYPALKARKVFQEFLESVASAAYQELKVHKEFLA
jgi:hypothetical protein